MGFAGFQTVKCGVRPAKDGVAGLCHGVPQGQAKTHPHPDAGRGCENKVGVDSLVKSGEDRFELFPDTVASQILDHDNEFIPAKACEEVYVAQAESYPTGEFREKGVAGLMPVNVVDGFKVVQVNDTDSGLSYAALGQPAKMTVQRSPVWQASHGIVQCHEPQPLLERLLACDIPLNADKMTDRAITVTEWRHGQGIPEGRAVFTVVQDFSAEGFTPCQGRPQRRNRQGIRAGALEQTTVPADHFPGAVSGDRSEGSVRIDNQLIRVSNQRPLRNSIQGAAEQRISDHPGHQSFHSGHPDPAPDPNRGHPLA